MILAVDGREVQDPKGLNFRLAIGALGDAGRARRAGGAAAGRAVICRWRRRPIGPSRRPTTLEGDQPLAGATVANLSPGLNKDLGIDVFEQGVVVLKVARGSPAARLRLLPGDRVRALAGRQVREVGELARLLRAARPPWRLEIERDGQKLAVVIG